MQSVATMERSASIRVVGFSTPSTTIWPHASHSTFSPPSHQEPSPLAILKGETSLPKLRCRTRPPERGVPHESVVVQRRSDSLPIESLPRDVPQTASTVSSSHGSTSTPAIAIPTSHTWYVSPLVMHCACTTQHHCTGLAGAFRLMQTLGMATGASRCPSAR